MFDHSFPTCAFFLSFFFFKVEISLHTLIPIGQDQSIVAQQAEMTVAECSLASCVRACLQIGSHTMPAQRLSQPTPTSLGQGCLRV